VPLEPGTRVGPYEITGQLGAGGMGEVCRARDTKLGREVALKVLPDAFANDPDRMSRFQREAMLLAALNHPNIAAIYGLEDSSGPRAIVMELVEGATLTGPVQVEDGLRIAKQIAEAIEYAHDRGIIHRDLKPANIKVTPDGTVKVLDFGLAKAMDDVSDTASAVAGSMSPTLSLGATYAGVILGTAAYMAPEQAKGRPADRRSDIWAFGIVLFEMLTGDRMFGGDSVPETLASVMKDPITFGKLPDDTPGAIRKLVARCLERDPRRRLQSIGEARILLEDAIAGTTIDEHRPLVAPAPAASKWPWAIAAFAVVIALAALGWIWSRPSPAPPTVTRFTLAPPEGATLTNYRSFASNLAVSPDGRYVTFVADEPNRERTLWVRAIDALSAQRLDRTEDAAYPFWSPDSQHIAYFAKNKLMRIAVAGGAPLTIADAPDGEGGTWYQEEGKDGVIVFAANQGGPLQRVLAQGGVPAPVTKLEEEETGHIFPQFLPDGRLLYLTRGGKPGIYVQSLASPQRTRVMDSVGRALFSPPGFLLYLRDNALLAHRLNLDSLHLEGEPVAIAEDVRSGGNNGRNGFAVSNNGLLAYRAGGSGGNAQVTIYNRAGKTEGILIERGENGPLALSPDGRLLLVAHGTRREDRDLWVKDLASGVYSPLTSTMGEERDPAWSPNSRQVVYVHDDGAKRVVFMTTIGSGKHVPVSTDGTFRGLFDWTPDGQSLLINQFGDPGNLGLLPAPIDGAPASTPGKPQMVFRERYAASQFRVSPDGKWIAYTSQQSGQPEIMVAAFPSLTDRRQVSSGGATQPLWRGDGKELFFAGRDQALKSVTVKTGASLEFGPVETLFQTPIVSNAFAFMYAVNRDGTRFVMREQFTGPTATAEPLYIVTNWTSLVAH
jgi:eukaryotic-like serine/threonine-protein kinase